MTQLHKPGVMPKDPQLRAQLDVALASVNRDPNRPLRMGWPVPNNVEVGFNEPNARFQSATETMAAILDLTDELLADTTHAEIIGHDLEWIADQIRRKAWARQRGEI